MLDKRKIRLMIKMASYEKQGAEEDLKISSYYKKDYVSMNVWATAIWFTIGYAIVAALIAFCTLEQILEKAYDTKASSLDGNGSRRLSDSFDSLLYRCKDVLQEKTQSCQAACEKNIIGICPVLKR